MENLEESDVQVMKQLLNKRSFQDGESMGVAKALVPSKYLSVRVLAYVSATNDAMVFIEGSSHFLYHMKNLYGALQEIRCERVDPLDRIDRRIEAALDVIRILGGSFKTNEHDEDTCNEWAIYDNSSCNACSENFYDSFQVAVMCQNCALAKCPSGCLLVSDAAIIQMIETSLPAREIEYIGNEQLIDFAQLFGLGQPNKAKEVSHQGGVIC